jgi:hypothetical protein
MKPASEERTNVGEGPADNPVTVFNCPLCGQAMKVSRELAGKKGKCNRCGATVTVPFDPADLKFEAFAELESSVQFIQFQETPPPIQTESPPVQETKPPRIETDGTTSGLVSLTAPVAQAPVESMLEVELLETPPVAPQNPLGNLARAAAANRPAWKPVRKGRWALVGTLTILFVGPIILGLGYRLSDLYSLRQTQKAQRESAEIDQSNNTPSAGPTAGVIAPAPPANSAQIAPLGPTPVQEAPTTRQTLQADLAFAMRQVEETVKRTEKGQTAIFDQDLGDQVNEVLRLRGELGLPNALVCKPGSGPDTSGPLGPWNKLQAILHPEKYPGCEARVEKP